MNQHNVIVHMTECRPNSTIASARVARFVAETLRDFVLVDTQDKAEEELLDGRTPDTLIIVNGPMAFCDFLPELAEMVHAAQQIVFIQQDYTIMPPSAESKAESPFRKAFADRKLRPDFWTTVKKNVETSMDAYINWNKLTYDPQPFKPLPEEPSLFYYGAYRVNRETDFKFYFKDAPYEVHISTTPIRAKKFLQLAPNVRIVPPFTGLGSMPPCSASLYIEDAKSHVEFHSPANRFYELLSAGIPILFDARTLKMLKLAGIVPDPEWVVCSQREVVNRLNDEDWLRECRAKQNLLWHRDYVGELRQELLMAWHKRQPPSGA